LRVKSSERYELKRPQTEQNQKQKKKMAISFARSPVVINPYEFPHRNAIFEKTFMYLFLTEKFFYLQNYFKKPTFQFASDVLEYSLLPISF